MSAKLTDIEREMVQLLATWNMLDTNSVINPEELFPEHTPQDNAHRRTISEMARKGFFKRHPDYPPGTNVFLTQYYLICQALDKWTRSKSKKQLDKFYARWKE